MSDLAGVVHRPVTQILAQEHPGYAANEEQGLGNGEEALLKCIYLAAH